MNFPEIGDLFRGRYQILNVVGTGGFSRVYHAKQTDLERSVAIKVLKPSTNHDKPLEEQQRKFESVSRRFEREAKLISKLRDPHTVVMHDYGRTDDGLFFMVLEYVDGLHIGELIERDGALTPDRVVKILRQALHSLHEAHAFGVLHRDIKPGNIMVYEHVGRVDNVKVLDFGIAKSIDEAASSAEKSNTSELTAEGILVGTPRYMSPEQIRGASDLGPPTDIYSLGLVAFEMIMGVKAVPADSSIKIISRHLDTDPIELPTHANVPRALRSTINRMLAKSVDERFSTCVDVLAQLDEWQSDRSFDWSIDDYPEIEDFTIDFMDEDEEPKKSSLVLIAAVAIVALTSIAVVGALISSNTASTEPSVDVVEKTTKPQIESPKPDEATALVDLKPVEEDDSPIEAADKAPTELEPDSPDDEIEKKADDVEAVDAVTQKEPEPTKKKRRKKKKKKSVIEKEKATVAETSPKKDEPKTESKKPTGLNIVPLGGN